MALINCPECGKEISDRAKSCPNCGCPVQKIIPNEPTYNNQPIENNYNFVPNMTYGYPYNQENIKSQKKKRHIVLISLLAIIALIVCCFMGQFARYYYNYRMSNRNIFEQYDLTATKEQIRKNHGNPDKNGYDRIIANGEYDQYDQTWLGMRGVIRIYYNTDERSCPVSKIYWISTDQMQYDETDENAEKVKKLFNSKYGDHKFDEDIGAFIWEERDTNGLTGNEYGLFVKDSQSENNEYNSIIVEYNEYIFEINNH